MRLACIRLVGGTMAAGLAGSCWQCREPRVRPSPGRLHAQAADASITRAPAFSAKQLLEPPADGWLTNGGTLFNQRYSPLDAINRETVGNLRGVWRSRLNGSGAGSKYSGEAQPIVHDGVIYVVTGADDVFALSVASGAILWSYEANLDPDISTVCCGWTSRGVALGDGRVYVGQLDGRLVALDQQTGEPVWSVQAERWEDGYTITSAPLYVDGLIVTGFAGAERGIRGRVKAYDATESAATIASAFTGTDIDEEIPADGESYLGGNVWWSFDSVDRNPGRARHDNEPAGVATTPRRPVLQRIDRDGGWAVVRQPERRTVHGARLE